MKYITTAILFTLLIAHVQGQSNKFICVKGTQFLKAGKAYHCIGANYWYDDLLGVDFAGKMRLIKEYDFLVYKGVKNLRVMAAVECIGQINGVLRVEPPLQTAAGVFDENVLYGLDFLLAEMAKRQMNAVLFLSNNWQWSGGFLQYLNWNKKIADSVLARKLEWDEMRDYVSLFYNCKPCIVHYAAQLALIINRTNSINGVAYTKDPTIMSWELANEPRPMRPTSIPAYKQWITRMASLIKKIDRNHLITIGSEDDIGSESMDVNKEVHSLNNIHYATIHIWPKNWALFKDTSIAKDFHVVIKNSVDYIDRHAALLALIKKPLVTEEFGLPRDQQLFQPGTETSFRDALMILFLQSLIKAFESNV